MLDYKFFLDLSSYLNSQWGGSFTEKEVAENAKSYLFDFQYSKENKTVSADIQILMDGLKEDLKNNHTSKSGCYLKQLENALGI